MIGPRIAPALHRLHLCRLTRIKKNASVKSSKRACHPRETEGQSTRENEEVAPAEAQQDMGKASDARAEATDELSMDVLEAVAGGVISRVTPKPT
jgi:hypothetical protein